MASVESKLQDKLHFLEMYRKQLIQKGSKEEDQEVSLLAGEISALQDVINNKLHKNESGLNKIKGRLSGYQKTLEIIKG